MILTEREISLDRAHRKLNKEEMDGLPIAVRYYQGETFLKQNHIVHWHREFEISYCQKGPISSIIDNREVVLHENQAMFVNSNVLHGSGSFPPGARAFAIFADPSFIAGSEKINTIWTKYLFPIINEPTLRWCIFDDEKIWRIACIDEVKNILELAKETPSFYEFRIRQSLTQILQILFEHLHEEHIYSEAHQLPQSLQIMISYISNHYSENIVVEDIANAANISKRECFRQFQNSSYVSPNLYLNALRIQKSCELLSETDQSITEISFSTGFQSSSYFTSRFKNMMGCTPNEYRQKSKR